MEDAADDPSRSAGVFDRYADGLHAYAWSLLADPDAAADATVDALLVAGASADALADRTRLRPWLYALVRNEALRRCPAADRPSLGAEAAELALRHRLSPADVAAVLGHPAEDADRLATAVAHTPAALGPLPAPAPARRWDLAAGDPARRAEVVRRARPFDHDGFPIPLDRPRLSGRALVWSAVAVVAVALGLLVLPAGGPAATGPVAVGRVVAAAVPPAQVRSEQHQVAPTLAATGLVAGPTPASTVPGTRPAAAPDRGADRRPVPRGAGAPAPASTAEAPSVPDGGERTAPISMSFTWAPAESVGCTRRWTAVLTARTGGPRAAGVVLVQAVWSDGGRPHIVPLRRDGAAWTGQLTGLPLDLSVAVTVRGSTAGGIAVAPDRGVLAHSC